MGETESGIVCGLPSEDSGSSCRQRVAKERTRLASVHNDDIRGVPFGLIEHLVIFSLAISSSQRTKSIHPLGMALSGISGCPAVSSFWAMVIPPTSLMPQSVASGCIDFV